MTGESLFALFDGVRYLFVFNSFMHKDLREFDFAELVGLARDHGRPISVSCGKALIIPPQSAIGQPGDPSPSASGSVSSNRHSWPHLGHFIGTSPIRHGLREITRSLYAR